MADIVEFLLARYAEEEADARSAVGEEGAYWLHLGRGELVAGDDPGLSVTSDLTALRRWNIGDHIARWDPARVLAECAAKRQVVELHRGHHECVGELHGEIDTVLVAPGYLHENDPTLRLLALPYAGHPDYDPAWRLGDTP